ncbi:hypothetical protein D3C81_1655210 [compost metagenome]
MNSEMAMKSRPMMTHSPGPYRHRSSISACPGPDSAKAWPSHGAALASTAQATRPYTTTSLAALCKAACERAWRCAPRFCARIGTSAPGKAKYRQ